MPYSLHFHDMNMLYSKCHPGWGSVQGMLHLVRLRLGDTGRAPSSKACLERVRRRGPLEGPRERGPSSMTAVPSPLVRTSTMVVAGTTLV